MSDPIDISPVSGFPEWLPATRLVEQEILATIRDTFELFGFTPIETPAVERMAVLTAKGGIQRQIFSVGRPAIEGGSSSVDLGLHFDLTVPLARYVAARQSDLVFPFRRYQMQKVWRGERAQRGRFREFYQCDIDIIGNESLGLLYDAEIARVIGAVFDALDVPAIQVRISNRKILTALMSAAGLGSDQTDEALRRIDRASGKPAEEVGSKLAAAGFDAAVAEATAELLAADGLDAARAVLESRGADVEGVEELRTVHDAAVALGMREEQLRVDLGLARGLDYYTGTVYETVVTGHEDWGSVCGGGRYDDLAGYFTSRRLPGVGVSIGVTRLLDLLTRSEIKSIGPKTPTKVMITVMDRAHLDHYLSWAAELRSAGVPSEVYLQERRLGDQLRYAGDLGIPLAVIAGGDELARGTVQLRDMTSGEQSEVEQGALVAEARSRLGR